MQTDVSFPCSAKLSGKKTKAECFEGGPFFVLCCVARVGRHLAFTDAVLRNEWCKGANYLNWEVIMIFVGFSCLGRVMMCTKGT